MPSTVETIREKIAALKKQRNAVILAHNYQLPEVQDVADIVADSLMLSRRAAESAADVIVFCGVHFMAETAAVLSPSKTVLLPDLGAGCSLSATVTAADVRRWKAQHPGAVVVMYVNCSAEVKAEADYCCTSSNAVKVVQAIPPEKEILFGPDMYLGQWVRQQTGRTIHLWPGSCHVHHLIKTDDIKRLKAHHPAAEVLIHPECGCTSSSLGIADKVLSTEGMVRHARESQSQEFIVATETGILHKMQKENPRKAFHATDRKAVCEFMKMITLEKVLWSLEDMRHVVSVPADIAARARLSIERMIAIG